jgi:hypothetical protein
MLERKQKMNLSDRERMYLEWIKEDHGIRIYECALELIEKKEEDYTKYSTLLEKAHEKFNSKVSSL